MVILIRFLLIVLIPIILSVLCNAVISWRTQKQQSVAASTANAEYMVFSLTSRQAVQYKHAFKQIGHSIDINLNCDNK